jgi:hypothetical protein
MALRDYFHEKWNEPPPELLSSPVTSLGPTMEARDEWALSYLSIMRMQPITEAFDDDASGFVSVTEVNNLTSQRPLDWRSV